MTGSYLLFFTISCFLLCAVRARVVVSSNGVAHQSQDGRTSCSGVHYPGMGCFELQPPFNNTGWLPRSPSFIGTSFLLYTRHNRNDPQRLLADRSSTIDNSNFNSDNPTKILVHGFLQQRGDDFLIDTKNALLDEDQLNVIIVGWSGGAGFPYGQAVANTRVVGAQLARMVRALASATGTSLSRVHIIGHSLGAHVAGYAGSRLAGLGRITGLDPAQPGYHGYEPAVRLDPTDALLVDVIHTDALPYDQVHGYGMIEPVGHMDFYPNGGHSQPGCRQDNSYMDVVGDLFSEGLSAAESDISCSHERSTQLFLASISSRGSCSFEAYPCPSEPLFARGECTSCGNIPCPVMGYRADFYSRARGVFYLNTTSTAPYCGHHQFVNLTMSSSMGNTDGSLKVKVFGSRAQTEWVEMKSGALNGGDVLSRVFISDRSLGHVHKVDVKFTGASGLFSWGTNRVILGKVKVASPLEGHPKYFCQQNSILDDGVTLSLTAGFDQQESCYNYN